MDPAQPLRDFEPAKRFFIGIDSDGCVFDSMEIKHKECFVPMFIKHYGLQAVSKYARQTWEFVNLYSTTRGMNRFPALVRSLDLLRDRTEVKVRQVQVPDSLPIQEWIQRETKLGNAALEAEVARGNRALAPTKAWSEAVNRAVADIVHGVPPFPLFRESLARMNAAADCIVVSQTPGEALGREWKEHDLAEAVRLIAGQEMGTKTEHLEFAAKGKYRPECILMIGDAPGDLKAATANGALFYPIIPGREEASWNRFHEEALNRFLEGTYLGAYQASCLAEFESSLPKEPPWIGS